MSVHVDPQVPVVGETLVADGARPQFSGMPAHVQFQRLAVRIPPPAVIADVGQRGLQFRVLGQFVLVDVAHVHCHARHRPELPSALGTSGRHLRQVGADVIFQAVLRRQSLPALVAAEEFRRASAVQPKMLSEADGGGELFATELAGLRRPLSVMQLPVLAQRIRFGEPATVSYKMLSKTRICTAEMAVRYAALSACRKVHACHCNSLGGAT